MKAAFTPFDPVRIPLAAGRPGVFCVEASAGTGKTYSITGLVLRLVCEEGLSLDEILVVTYTRAAAAELRGRIAERLAAAERDLEALRDGGGVDAAAEMAFRDDFVGAWVQHAASAVADGEGDAALGEWLRRVQRARQRVDAATFTTIHGFCQRMLEWHAFESDQPLGIGFLEDESTVSARIVNDLWAELVETAPEAVLADAQLDVAHFGRAVKLAIGNRSAVLRTLAGKGDGKVGGSGVGEHGGGATERGARSEMASAIDACHARLEAARAELRAFFTSQQEPLLAWARELAGHARKGNWTKGFSELTSLDAKAVTEGLEAFLLPRLERAANADMLAEPFWVDAVRYLGSDLLADGLLMRGKAGKERSQELLAHRLRHELAALANELPASGEVQSDLIVAACREARRRFADVLASRAEVTFDDLVTRLADRVREEATTPDADGSGPLTRAVRSRYRAALIDEFQDTDDAQWTLFEKAFLDSDDHRLFLIGDPKQAIYAFRGADIRTYLHARTRVNHVASHRLQLLGESREETLRGAGLHTMTRNFRSDGAFIVALNRFMGALHHESAHDTPADAPPLQLTSPCRPAGQPGDAIPGFFDRENDPTGIDFILVDWNEPTPRADGQDCVTPDAPPARLRLDPDAHNEAPWTTQPLVFRPMAVPDPHPDERPEGHPDAVVLENNGTCKQVLWTVVAEDIRRLVHSPVELMARKADPQKGRDAQWRPVAPGDIAVLVSAWRDGASIAAALRARGVPVVLMSGQIVWESDEAADLANLLACILDPGYLPHVFTTLAGPLFSVPTQTLAHLAGHDDDQLDQWTERLRDWSRTWEEHGLLRMMAQVLDLRVHPHDGLPTTSPDAPTRRDALLRTSDGERRLTNLLQLVELLHAESSGQFAGPQAQLDLLRTRQQSSSSPAHTPDDPRKQRLDTDDAAVRITTVHGSKGLEYPIVFLPTFDGRGVGGSPSAPIILPGPDAEPAPAPAAEDTAEPREDHAARTAHSPPPARDTQALYPTADILAEATLHEGPPPAVRHDRSSEEESRRLLYVALTRARHQAVLYVRDWNDGGGLNPSTIHHFATEPARRGHAATNTTLGRLLRVTPRIRTLADHPAQIATLAHELATRRGDKDPQLLMGDVCAELGSVLNPRGERLFLVPRQPSDLPCPAHARRGAAVDSRLAEAARAALPPEPPPISRERFHDPAYRAGSFTSLARGVEHGPPGDAPGAGAPTAPTDALAEALEELQRDRRGTDEVTLEGDAARDEVPEGPDEAAVPDLELGEATATHLLFDESRIVGRDFGTAIHELLEKADFAAELGSAAEGERAQQGTLREATTSVLRRYGFQLAGPAVDTLAADVHMFLKAPLGGALEGTALADIPRERRIDELEFLLPLRTTLEPGALARAFEVGGPPPAQTSWGQAPGAWDRWLVEVRQLSFHAFHGYLKGFVDLLFATEAQPRRLHLLDYKTNKLHQREMTPEQAHAAYEQPALVEAMIHSRYVLQYHLYQVALFRLLRTRLGRNFDWDSHMGGVWYPFLRGVQSADTDPVHGSSLRRGVFHDQPPRERIEALDALFDGRTVAEGGRAPEATAGAPVSAHTGGTP